MSKLTVTEARAALPSILDRVAEGEEVTITRHGRAVAVVLRPDAVRARRATSTIEDAQRIGELLSVARQRPLPPDGLSNGRAEQLVEILRLGRDRA